MKKIKFKKLKEVVKKHPYRTLVSVIIILAILFILFGNNNEDSEEAATEAKVRTSEIIAVNDFSSGAIGSFAPTAAGNSFVVRTQSGGRVDSTTKTGEEVAQGEVLAELENSSQRAALTQAQGVYEAAVAGSASSDIGLSEAKTSLSAAKQSSIETNLSALSTYNSVLFNTVDTLFTNPRLSNPGIRIDAQGKADRLGSDRVKMNETLRTWRNQATSLSVNTDSEKLIASLDEAVSNINELSVMIDTFIVLLPKQGSDGIFSESEITTLQSSFASAKSSLNTQRSNLQNSKTNLMQAKEAVNSATVAASGSEVSSADAAIKQALGSLQAARSAYEKTIVRAPFAGRVSSLNVSEGDIISAGTDIAIIVPEDGVETEQSFQLPLSAVKYTPTGAYVLSPDENNTLNAIEVETGLVTTSNITVTGLTGNEIIIKDVRGLNQGDKVNTQ